MTLSIIVDLLIAAVLALSLYLGYKKGIVRGLLALAASIIAIITASVVADYASQFLIEEFVRPAAHEAVEQRMDELGEMNLTIAPREEIEELLLGVDSELIREKALKLLEEIDLRTDASEVTAFDPLTVTLELVDSVLYGAVQTLLSAVICILCFFLISLALRPVQRLIEDAFELPILRQVNQLGGIISGAATGVLLILIVVWALRTADLYLTDDVVDNSCLLKFAVNCLETIGSIIGIHS